MWDIAYSSIIGPDYLGPQQFAEKFHKITFKGNKYVLISYQYHFSVEPTGKKILWKNFQIDVFSIFHIFLTTQICSKMCTRFRGLYLGNRPIENLLLGIFGNLRTSTFRKWQSPLVYFFLQMIMLQTRCVAQYGISIFLVAVKQNR